MAILLGVGLGALLALLPTAVLKILGFTSAGVAAGSVAAFIHSMIGNVSAGSLFALLQSIGATGVSASAAGGLGAIGSFLGGVIASIV